jgi:hypothetical protein
VGGGYGIKHMLWLGWSLFISIWLIGRFHVAVTATSIWLCVKLGAIGNEVYGEQIND